MFSTVVRRWSCKEYPPVMAGLRRFLDQRLARMIQAFLGTEPGQRKPWRMTLQWAELRELIVTGGIFDRPARFLAR
jgi:hypothetical protein